VAAVAVAAAAALMTSFPAAAGAEPATAEACVARLKQLTAWARAEQGLGTVESAEAQAVAEASSRLRADGVDGHHDASVIAVLLVDRSCDVAFENLIRSPPHRAWIFHSENCGMGWGAVVDPGGTSRFISGDFVKAGPEACILDEGALRAAYPPPPREAARVAGSDRYDTAARLSRRVFDPGVEAVFIATGEDYPDALAAGPAAAKLGGPVLLTTGGKLAAATAAELARLKPGRVVVVGGTSAVSAAVEAELRRYAASVRRVAGADRYDTAARVSAAFFSPGVDAVYVATGEDYPDALAAGAAAAKRGGPVLLTRKGSLPPATAAELSRLQGGAPVVVGGDGVITFLTRWHIGRAARPAQGGSAWAVGADRYATAVAATSQVALDSGHEPMFIATGDDYPDALAAGPAAAAAGGHLLLVPRASVPAVVSAELRRIRPRPVVVVGGTSAVSDAAKATIDRHLADTFDRWAR